MSDLTPTFFGPDPDFPTFATFDPDFPTRRLPQYRPDQELFFLAPPSSQARVNATHACGIPMKSML